MMTDNRIRLILLDFDGTLADTRHANTQAYVAALREAGYGLTEQEYQTHYFGMRCDEFLTRYGISDPAERERLRRRKIELYPTFFDTVRLNRPLWDFCQAFRAEGGRVWIVSTGSRDNIENAMRHLGIAGPETGVAAATDIPVGWDDTTRAKSGSPAENSNPAKDGSPALNRLSAGNNYLTGNNASAKNGARARSCDPSPDANGAVDGILTGVDIVHSKPAPDCFLEAMRREGCTPRETLIFEDSPIGIEAAQRSGASYFVVKL